MSSLLFWIPYLIVFVIDRVEAFRGVSNPKTWRLYVGIGITIVVAWLAEDAVSGSWQKVAYFTIWGIGYPASYVWNNSADTSGDAF